MRVLDIAYVDAFLTTGTVVSMPTRDKIWELVNQLDSTVKAGFRKFYAESDENKRQVNEAFAMMEGDPNTTKEDVRLLVQKYLEGECVD